MNHMNVPITSTWSWCVMLYGRITMMVSSWFCLWLLVHKVRSKPGKWIKQKTNTLKLPSPASFWEVSSWRRHSCPPDRSTRGPEYVESCSSPAQIHWQYTSEQLSLPKKCNQCPTSAFQILSLKTPALCRKGNDHGMDVRSAYLYIALRTTAFRRERETCSRAMMESRSRYEVASRENRAGSSHSRSKLLYKQWWEFTFKPYYAVSQFCTFSVL